MQKIPEMTKTERDAVNFAKSGLPLGPFYKVLVGYIERVEAYLEERRRATASEVNPEYPFYPHLSEEGAKEAGLIIEAFKGEILKTIKAMIFELYVDLPSFIESDSWTNYRIAIMRGFKDYGNRKHAEHDFREIRAQIFKDFREEIIKDIAEDILEESTELKAEIESLRKQLFARNF